MERTKEIELNFDKWEDNFGLSSEDIEYLLAENKRLREALEYYANLRDRLYHDAQEGELYEHWWSRQSEVAIKALREERMP